MTPPPVRKPEPCPIPVPGILGRSIWPRGVKCQMLLRDFSVWLTPAALEARALIDLADGGN